MESLSQKEKELETLSYMWFSNWISGEPWVGDHSLIYSTQDFIPLCFLLVILVRALRSFWTLVMGDLELRNYPRKQMKNGVDCEAKISKKPTWAWLNSCQGDKRFSLVTRYETLNNVSQNSRYKKLSKARLMQPFIFWNAFGSIMLSISVRKCSSLSKVIKVTI